MNELLVGMVSAASVGFGAILTLLGVLWKSKKDTETKQIEVDAQKHIAQIEADSSQQIHLVDVLAARVNVLETSSAEQDHLVMKLTREIAVEEAKNQLLTAEAAMLQREVDRCNKRIKEQDEYIRELRRTFQTEVADARAALDEASDSLE